MFPHALWLQRRSFARHRRLRRERCGVAGRLSPGVWLLPCCWSDASWPRACWSRWRAAGRVIRASARRRSTAIRSSRSRAPSFISLLLAPAFGRDRDCLCQRSDSGRSIALHRSSCFQGSQLIVAAGDKVLLYRERLVSSAWLGLLVAPPAAGRARPAILAVDVRHRPKDHAAGQCRRAILRETSSQRRTGKPLSI